LMSFKAQFFS